MNLYERLEDRRLLSGASPVAELAKEGGVSELARSEPGAVARLAHRPASPAVKVARAGGGQERATNPVAELAKDEGGAAVSELARSEPGAVAELARSGQDDDGGNGGGGDNGGGDDGGNGDNGGENGGGNEDQPSNPVAQLATTEGGAAVSELARSEPGAVAELARSDRDDDGEGDDEEEENGGGDGEGAPTNAVAEIAKSEGGAAVSRIARSAPFAVARLVRMRPS